MALVAETAEKEELRIGMETGQEILRRLDRIEEELSALRAFWNRSGCKRPRSR